MSKLKIMTFNVQHFENMNTGKIDYDAFADAIRALGADVVGLNEVYVDQVGAMAERLGWFPFFAKGCLIHDTPFGNGILSRFPLKTAEAIPVPDPDPRGYDGYYETRCVLKCTVDVHGALLTVLCTHFGLNPDEAENAVKTVLSAIEDRRCVLMGDLNLLPEDPILFPLRQRMTDTAPLLGTEDLSFPSDAPDRKIDYIFVSADIGIRAAEIPPLVLSDHRPYSAEIELTEQK